MGFGSTLAHRGLSAGLKTALASVFHLNAYKRETIIVPASLSNENRRRDRTSWAYNWMYLNMSLALWSGFSLNFIFAWSELLKQRHPLVCCYMVHLGNKI